MAKKGVFDIDKGYSKIIQEMKRAATLVVDVGVQAGSTAADGGDLVTVAAIHEFGTDNTPSRPFTRESFDQNVNELDKFMQGIGERIITNRISTNQGLNLVGQKMTGIIQKKIVDGPWTPNAPSTIRQKGSDKPLIDTGRLRQSIRHVVKPK
jgi:hypothetical protein